MASKRCSTDRSNNVRGSSIPFLSPLTYGSTNNDESGRTFSWDLTTACKPLLTAFHYISGKLACHGLHVAIVVKNSRPELLPAWPIGIHAQHFLARVIQKANERYPIDLFWLKALLDLCKPVEAREIFDSQRAISYIVHRSIAQRDLIYSGEGLTVLSVDCIFTFKSLLSDLGAEDAIPLFRDDCKESCVELLKHVNKMYRDIQLSKGYLRRTYTQFTYGEDTLEEVCEAYRARFGSEGVFDVPIAILQSRKSIVPRSVSEGIEERLQASPRKLPDPEKSHSREKAGRSVRALLSGPRSVHMSQLAPPFEEPSVTIDPTSSDLNRPKSPKGSLFESPRSPPLTPPRSNRLRAMSKSENLRAESSASQDSGTLVDQTETPPMVRLASRKRPIIRPFFGFAGSSAPFVSGEEPYDRRGKSVELNRSSSRSRSRSLKPSPEIASRASSATRSIKSTISRYKLTNSLSRLAPRRFISQPTSKFDWEQPGSPSLRGVESKFGWLQVMKRRRPHPAFASLPVQVC